MLYSLEIEWAWQSIHLADNHHASAAGGFGFQIKLAKSTVALFKPSNTATTSIDASNQIEQASSTDVAASSFAYRQRLLQHLSPQTLSNTHSSVSSSSTNIAASQINYSGQPIPSDNYWHQQVTSKLSSLSSSLFALLIR